MKLSEQTIQHILNLQSEYPVKRSALIPALHVAQEEIGYLPLEIQSEVAMLFGLETNEVHSVVTFYDMFYEHPVGKHLLHVCKNVSCQLRGAGNILQKLCEKLQVAPHEMSKDGEFTVIPSECLGACDRAPMMIADTKVIGPILENQIDQILDNVKKNSGRPSPTKNVEEYHG
ncbi:MAG: NAD(P)H-dependent oxidoreductase subunit E [Parachlamydiaceae bacterium]|nr:NAD(P)H-dependent oxidoreductase subunit E [Parachlamydiaceae bacterium]